MTDNPYPDGSGMKLNMGRDTMHYELHTAWDEGYAEGFAAGRAAATPDLRFEDIADRMATPLDFRRQQEAHRSDCACAMCVVLRDYIAAKSSPPAASPDERLREAARVLVERSAAAVCQPGQFRDNVGEAQWRLSDAITATRAALAADREAPDEAGRICCRGMGADGGCNICAAEATR